MSAGGRLLVGSYQGIDQLENDRAELIQKSFTKVAKTSGPGCFVQPRYDSTRLYIGLQNGLGFLQLRFGSWRYGAKISVANEMIEGILEDGDKTLWLTTRYGTAIRLRAPSLDPSFLLESSAVRIERFDEANGLSNEWVNAFAIDGRILFTTQKGLRHFDPESRTFQLDSSLRRPLCRYHLAL